MIATQLTFGGMRLRLLFGLGLGLISAILGIIITYIAYQGYKQNNSRPMLFVAIGFCFIFVLLFLLSLAPSTIAFLIATTDGFREFAPSSPELVQSSHLLWNSAV